MFITMIMPSYRYKTDDIQIFVISHNRAHLIKDCINSIFAQTAGVSEITVLDNESTDDTEVVVKSYKEKGVKYIKTYGFLSILRCKNLHPTSSSRCIIVA